MEVEAPRPLVPAPQAPTFIHLGDGHGAEWIVGAVGLYIQYELWLG